MRSSISVQVSKKIFGIIKNWEDGGGRGGCPNKHWRVGKRKLKLTSRGDVYFALKSNRGRTFNLIYNMLEYFFHLRAI